MAQVDLAGSLEFDGVLTDAQIDLALKSGCAAITDALKNASKNPVEVVLYTVGDCDICGGRH